jgi:hypothetical protein
MKVRDKRDGYFTISITIMVISLILTLGVTGFKIFSAFALGPLAPSCVELGTCDIWNNPLEAMLTPWTDIFGVFTYPMIWGIILGIIWLRTHNTMLVASVGTVIAGFLTIAGLNAVNPQIILVGATLVGLSIGVILYQLITSRLQYSSS